MFHTSHDIIKTTPKHLTDWKFMFCRYVLVYIIILLFDKCMTFNLIDFIAFDVIRKHEPLSIITASVMVFLPNINLDYACF